MKIALVHDYIKEYGGAERVLETLHEIYPQAPVFTTVYLPQFLGPHRERLRGWNIQTSFLQYIPFKQKLISIFRLVAPLAFKTFDFSGFDIVIVSATGAYSPNTIRPKTNDKRPIRICYCHTPPRYLYGFATAREWKNNIFIRVLGELANHFLRLIDFKSAQNVDYFIANSKNVAGRIKKFYKRKAVVIYPPVDIANGSPSQFAGSSAQKSAQARHSEEYFLAGGRIARPKHIDLIIKTFEKLNLPLKVFGRGFAGTKLESENSNIAFVGEVSDEEKLKLMKSAKAFVLASEDEDFGITPIEAMSCGTPVIAYRSGGIMESVVDGKTGVFFNELSVGSLTKAILHFNNIYYHSEFNPHNCLKQAEKFSKERFIKEIKDFVMEVSKNARATRS